MGGIAQDRNGQIIMAMITASSSNTSMIGGVLLPLLNG